MTDHSGQYFGRYYLTERLGEGGMAVVYKAYDTRLERDIAIKIIRSGAFPSDDLAEILKRFEREAKSLAKLSHPSIVKVYDFGEHDGSPFLVMEYLSGGTLKKLLGKPIPWQDAVRLILPVARGVAYAHKRGLLHRDIKPANVLITDDGEPMLSDFGIAKLFEGDQTTALTGSGMAIGTPEYMAPEQWTGSTSPYSDQYSLGIVLYEMVAGRKPYVADTPGAILIKQVTEPLPGPRKFVANLPEALEHILIKALAKEPGDRYPDVNALIGALESLNVSTQAIPRVERKAVEETQKASIPELVQTVAAQRSEPVDVETINVADLSSAPQKEEDLSPVSTVVKTRPLVKLSPKNVGILAGGIVILLAAWFGLPLVGRLFSSLPMETENVTATSLSGAVVIETKTLTPIPASKTPTPTTAPTSTFTPKPLLFGGAKIGVLVNDKGSFSVELIDPEDQTSLQIPLGANIGEKLNWSLDGAKFLYTVGGNVNAYDLNTGKSSLITNSPFDYAYGMTWSPNGNLIAFESKKETANTAITLINPDGNGRKILVTGYFEDWSPDGKFILYRVGGWGSDGGVSRIEYISIEDLSRGIVADGERGSWSPNSDLILYELDGNDYRYTSMQLYNFVKKEYEGQLIEKTRQMYSGYSWAPDGNFITLRDPDNETISIIGVLSKEKKEIFDADEYSQSLGYTPPIWSFDGQKLVITTDTYVNRDRVESIFIVDHTTQQVTEIGQGESPIWSPDGKWIAFTSTRDGESPALYVVRADGTDLRKLSADGVSCYSPHWIK